MRTGCCGRKVLATTRRRARKPASQLLHWRKQLPCSQEAAKEDGGSTARANASRKHWKSKGRWGVTGGEAGAAERNALTSSRLRQMGQE